MQCWTKVLRRRRFELLSGPLCLTSDAVQRDTSGVVPPNVTWCDTSLERPPVYRV